MNYVPFGDLGFDVSRLGFGMMRLPTVSDEQGKTVIDRPEAIRMLRYAIDHGLSYVDTAYPYHGGESEIVTGLALKDGYRERVTLTTKLPQWLVKEHADMDKFLDEQLKKLDVPHVDFYLLHALDREAFHKLQRLDYKSFIKRAKADGRVKHIGFSFHDEHEVFREIVDDYDGWELAQIQLNYLDDEYQAGESGMRYAGERGINIVVMEPLRGGALANPPQSVRAMMEENGRHYSPVEWAFRYAGDFAEVKTILSGMHTMEQVKDNLDVFSRVAVGSLSERDRGFIRELKEAYLKRIAIGCTRCEYCQPCPQGVLIPRIFAAVNEAFMFEDDSRFSNPYRQIVKEQGDAARCVACGQCESVCPQQLPIIRLLQDAAARA